MLLLIYSFGHYNVKKVVEILGRVQRRATTMVRELEAKTYEERMGMKLGVSNLVERRTRV